MNKTSIEWVRNPDGNQGYTWNPITGCLNHNNGLCKGGGFPCYAYKLACGRLRQRYLANKHCAPVLEPPMHYIPSPQNQADPFYPRFWEERLKKPYNPIMSIGIFVCDMGELFGEWIPRKWQAEIFDVILNNPWHRFYLLTKQPQNLAKWSPFPDNCWVGVTVTKAEFISDAISNLACIEAGKRFISFEPLLGCVMPEGLFNFLDWLIIGTQTKPYKPPKIEWVEEIVRAADQAGIPVFLKDNLEPILPEEMPFYDVIDEDPMLTPRLRQEMPD